MSCRSAAPRSVRASDARWVSDGSTLTTRPRSISRSTPASHSGSGHPRVPRRNPSGRSPVARCSPRAPTGSRSCRTRAATWPSPRNSRRRVWACQRTRWGGSGQGRPAWAANRGRPSYRSAARSGGRPGQGRRPFHLRGADEVTQHSAERGVGGIEPGGQHPGGVGHVPGRGDDGADQVGVEVVERGDHGVGSHRPHGRRPGGEVAGLGAEAQADVGLGRLGGEVDHAVQRFQGAAGLAGGEGVERLGRSRCRRGGGRSRFRVHGPR